MPFRVGASIPLLQATRPVQRSAMARSGHSAQSSAGHAPSLEVPYLQVVEVPLRDVAQIEVGLDDVVGRRYPCLIACEQPHRQQRIDIAVHSLVVAPQPAG